MIVANKSKQAKIGPREGTQVVWPAGLEQRLGISAPTRWRWEKQHKLPARDVDIGGKTGWRRETINALIGEKEAA